MDFLQFDHIFWTLLRYMHSVLYFIHILYKNRYRDINFVAFIIWEFLGGVKFQEKQINYDDRKKVRRLFLNSWVSQRIT